MSTVPSLVELRLTSFKTFTEERLTFEPLTILVGRNGSGKSNALDALSLLALLADEREVSDLERGDAEVAGLRGGLSGAAPFGASPVRLGCTVQYGERTLHLDLALDPGTQPEIVSEVLTLSERRRRDRTLVTSRAEGGGIANTETYSAGMPRSFKFLSSRLAVAQAITKVPTDTKARTLVVDCCRAVLNALRGVFVLDPQPAQMREYVRIGSPPDRSGATVSASAYRLRSEDPSAWERLKVLLQGLVETDLTDLTFLEAALPGHDPVDVMVAMDELAGTHSFVSSAQLMSDGTLRYLAVVASLLDLPAEERVTDATTPRMLVIEEIENGLFPSQASEVLDLLRDEARSRSVTLIATTHSPALLDALRVEDHSGVVVCSRREDGRSQLRRLTAHPQYVEIAGSGSVGRAATMGLLEEEREPPRRSLADLFAS